MNRIEVERLSHAYDGGAVLSDVAIAVAPGEILCLLGPSGCGKSTLLRLIAGLERVQAGRVAIDGEVVADGRTHVAPERRAVGLVFQDFALFPHLSVLDNVAFGLFRAPPAARRARAATMLRMLGMADRGADFPHMLSGGQQQRVALARALAPEPRVLLLDEPFSGLDVALRGRLREDTLHVLKRSGTAAVLVTHDPEEAMFLADRIAVMRAGRIVQVGPPADLYARPADAFVASLFGEVNRLEGRVRAGAVVTAMGAFAAPGLLDGVEAAVLVRPEGVHLRPAVGGPVARVLTARMLGADTLVHLAVSGQSGEPLHLHARLPSNGPLPEGSAWSVELAPEQTFVFPIAAPSTDAR